MAPFTSRDRIIGCDDLILITGAHGFIGSKLVATLLELGFTNLRCFTRSSDPITSLKSPEHSTGIHVDVVRGNLLSKEDCEAATRNVKILYHLAAGRGEKSFPEAFMNSVVTTKNLLDACFEHQCLKRFVNVSSFAVYSNRNKPHGGLLDESCPIEPHANDRGEAYCYAKVKQDELVISYCRKWNIPYVIVRPGYVYGPGNTAISSRVGIGIFGFFLHLGGGNTIPLTYVDNCAEAVALSGLVKNVDGESFNVVDEDLPSSRQFLRLYKRNVSNFNSIYMPHWLSYTLCFLWERYSAWSTGQLPPVFNRNRWHVDWKKTSYSNQKLKQLLGWMPKVSTAEALDRYFESCRDEQHA